MSLMLGLFWLARSVNICVYPPPITMPRIADKPTSHPSISGPSTASHVPSVGLSLGLSPQQTRCAHSPYRDKRSHTRSQHYEAKHARPRCPECDREFGSKDSMEKVSICSQTTFHNHMVTPPQHYAAKHRFECNECDDEFTTEEARDEVRSLWRLLAGQILTRSPSTTMQLMLR